MRLAWPDWFRPSSYPIFGLVACLAGTLTLFVISSYHQQHRDQKLFDAETAKLINGMRQSMTATEELLRAASGLVASHPDLSADDWRLFVDANDLRQRFPGFQGIGNLKYGERDQEMAGNGTPGAASAGTLTVVMMEPAHWRDLAGLTGRDPIREAAMARARDLDMPARTALLQFPATTTAASQPGFLVFSPVYARRERWETVPQRRHALIGFVVMPFAMPVLVPGLMQNRYQEARDYFRIEVFDGRPTTGTKSFDSAEHEGFTPPVKPMLTSEVVTERFGTEMGYRFSSLPAYEAIHSSWLPQALLMAGLGVSALVFGLLEALQHHSAFATAAREDSVALRLELVHRVKNMLAVVQSLANRSLPEAGNGQDRHQQFTNRIDALARAHTMIVENAWLGTDIGELIRSELAPLAHRATVTGPQVALSPQVSQSLALAVNELAIEAMRRRVDALNVTWTSVLGPEPSVLITWCEHGGKEDCGAEAREQLELLGFLIKASFDSSTGSTTYVFTVPLD